VTVSRRAAISPLNCETPAVVQSTGNLAISALRLAGRTDTTEATRWASRSMDRPFTILHLT